MVRHVDFINGRVRATRSFTRWDMLDVVIGVQTNLKGGGRRFQWFPPAVTSPHYFAGSVVIHSTELAPFSYAIPFG
jgi:hypothetical protein